ncbi:MAG TPA: hypothetical protein VJ890_23380 [Vineibacter sp.]|nr:hypothetical protein [Vineibacter sp.]
MFDTLTILAAAGACYVVAGLVFLSGLGADAIRNDADCAALHAVTKVSAQARSACIVGNVVFVVTWPVFLIIGTVMSVRSGGSHDPQ